MALSLEKLNALGLTDDQRAALKAMLREEAANRRLTFKVGHKGAVSIYGLGRFPVTLYLSQLRKLRDESAIENAIAFGEANGAREQSA